VLDCVEKMLSKKQQLEYMSNKQCMVNDFDIFNILIQVICNGISDYNISPELLQMIRSVNICIKEILNKNFIIW